MEVTELGSKSNNKDDDFFNLIRVQNIPSHLKDSLAKIIKEEGFLTYTIETNLIMPDGVNATGDFYVAQIRGNTANTVKEISLFIKSILPSGGLSTLDDVYLREIFVYTKLKKIFTELQTKANVPEYERFEMVKTYDDSNEKVLIMDNLTVKGYKTLEKLTSIPSLHLCEKAMEQLAKFHSLSFVMKHERKEFFEKEIMCKKILVNDNHPWLELLKKTTKNALEALKTDEAKERLSKYLSSSNLCDKFKYYMDNEDINIGVFCHGDYHVLNIMTRQKEGASMELIPIDYQMTYYGHPVNDIIRFIFGTSDREFRKNHLNHLMSLYYDTLENYLLYFDLKAQQIYPRKQYEQDFKERLDFFVLLGIHYLPFYFITDKREFDLCMDMSTTFMPHSSLYIRRWNELVDDLMEWGIL